VWTSPFRIFAIPMIQGEFRLAVAFSVAFVAASAPCRARDLSLNEAETLLATHNRELRASRRAVESAEAQRLIAGARPNATFSINSSGINSNPGIGAGPIGQKRIDTVFRIDQPFERGDKRELRLDVASGLQRAAENDSLDVLRQQLAALRAAYFDLKQVQEKVVVLADTAQLFTGTLAAAQARLKAGDLAPADVAKVQVDYERAQNEARSVQGELVRMQLALAYMIGAEANAGELRAADPWPAPQPVDPATVEQAIESRPDVLAARARAGAAEKARDLARAQRTRDFVIGAQYERFPGSLPVNSIGFGVAVPLFTGYDFSGDIQKAEVDRYAALDALSRARALAGIELRRAASDLNTAAARLERFETSLLGAAGRSAQAAEFAFQRGAISVLEVLDSRRTLRAVQVESVAARADYAKALAAWRSSLSTAEQLGSR
jgi:cobalt-zinc-cadmium efflux system outer membrane protein